MLDQGKRSLDGENSLENNRSCDRDRERNAEEEGEYSVERTEERGARMRDTELEEHSEAPQLHGFEDIRASCRHCDPPLAQRSAQGQHRTADARGTRQVQQKWTGDARVKASENVQGCHGSQERTAVHHSPGSLDQDRSQERR